MPDNYKAKIAHLFDNGDKLELEAHVEADSHDTAYECARQRLAQVISQLASADAIEINKTKIEMAG